MSEPVQTALFEEDYFHRSLGAVISQPDVALTELIANAWDAGAISVRITLPTETDDELLVEDDGIGMTREEFETRWRTLAYNRGAHQGDSVEFPPGIRRAPRAA